MVLDVYPEISPDGRYVAYQSNESGQFEIYVRPFPKMEDGRWQVSIGGGTRPVWARNGRELFYLNASNTLIVLPTQTGGAAFVAGNPAKVFETRYSVPVSYRSFDISSDGKRFVMIKDFTTGDDKATPASLVVVEHWFEELKTRMLTK
jgi:serine/threonine-protein kinase